MTITIQANDHPHGGYTLLALRGGERVASATLRTLGNVLEFRRFHVQAAAQGHAVAILQVMVDWMRGRGDIITAEFAGDEAAIFAPIGFRTQSRFRMSRALREYERQPIKLPPGCTLRHPTPDDEPLIAWHMFDSYLQTTDEPMVASNRAQAAEMTRAMFGGDYCRFLYDCSYLALDERGRIVGNACIGDVSTAGRESTASMINISIIKDWRGRRLGRALFAATANAAKAAGYTHLQLYVTVGNDPAIALYNSFGLIRVGEPYYEGVLYL